LLATHHPRPDWLRHAIESVLAQSFADFELLVLDDSCSPSVDAITGSYTDARIRYLPGPGKGPGHNHAFGISEAAGPLVSIINHDDSWEPTMLERLLEAYRSVPNAVLAFADHSVMDESGIVDSARSDALSLQWGRTSLAPGVHQPFSRIALIDGAVGVAVAAVFCRDVAANLDPRSGRYYDRYLAYLLARTGRPAVYVPQRLAIWRESSSNLTSNRSVKSSLARLWMSWRFFNDAALADLRRPLGKEILNGALGVLGSARSVARSKIRAVSVGTRAH
jgi:glycosyltransferase involved in cell wall biosynthesis